MEDVSAQQGACQKQSADHERGDTTGFGHFCLYLESLLTLEHSETLATLFGYPPAKIDKIKNSDNPSHEFVQLMSERGQICESDISPFINALKSEPVGLNGVAVKVEKAFQHLVKVPPSTVINDFKEKKTRFQEQLKTKYENVCGASRPVPYLRKQFSVNKLFVESGAEFLVKTEGSEEVWSPLKSCRSILIDPQVQSKRRILEGEPGFGKSMFSLQIAHDWINNHESMKDVEILILLRLRQYKNVSSIYAAIKRSLLPKESDLSEQDIEEILRHFQSSTLIILDGYDEYADQENEDTDVNLIINGDMFPDYEVIVTSRRLPPAHSSNTQRIRLTGFDDTSRDTYIKKAVVCSDAQAAKEIKDFFSGNPLSGHLYHIPLFFVMAAHMTHWHTQFKNIKTVTKFFQSIIACLFSHEQIRETGTSKLDNQQSVNSHQKLSEVAYEGLGGQKQLVSWDKNFLCKRLGQALYDKYVRIGILIEEEMFDFESFADKTEVSFYHKLFHEWFAAQYIAQKAARSDVGFQPWPVNFSVCYRDGRCVPFKRYRQCAKQHLLKRLDPTDANYMYQFACGLNADAAVKVIEHIDDAECFMDCTLMCIREWGGNLADILHTVTSLCSQGFIINHTHTSMHEEATMEVVKFASSRKIPILRLLLSDCLDFSFFSSGILHLKRSNLHVPVIPALGELQIWGSGLEISEEDMNGILQYSSKCLGLKVLMFFQCFLPRYIVVTEPLRSRDFTVLWSPAKAYILNFESHQWEVTQSFSNIEFRKIDEECEAAKNARANRGAPISDKEYEGVRRVVRQLYAKNH